MKLNCDMGESYGPWVMGNDAEIMPFIDMANIACGFHASDPQVMSKTVAMAKEHSVTIGAHPGYPDLMGFGRKEMQFSTEELINIILYQVGALQAICSVQDTVVSYVKPHGALYNAMMSNLDTYTTVVKAISLLNADIPLMIMAMRDNEKHIAIAKSQGIGLLFEAFCDRAYMNNGALQPRRQPGAVYEDLNSIVTQAKSLIENQPVATNTGEKLSLTANTICIHGDGDLALSSVQAIRSILKSL